MMTHTTTARRIKYRPLAAGEYAVEVHVPRAGCRTAGRVARLGNRWHALGIGAHAWTPALRTRADAASWLAYRAIAPGMAALQASVWANRILDNPTAHTGSDCLWAKAMADEANHLTAIDNAA